MAVKTEETIETLVAKIRSLPPELFDALDSVKWDGAYLGKDRQDALVGLGLVTITPGRVSAKQPDPFVTVKDALSKYASYSVETAIDRVKLERMEQPCFEDRVRLGGYDLPNTDFRSDAMRYLVENGVPEKNARKCYDLAWDNGHSSGYREVFNHLESLTEIFS